MKLLNEALRKIETLWSKEPKHAVHRGEKTFFQFRCILNNGISPDRFGDIDLQLPTEFKEFLLVSNGADLFKDEEYGQWGARIFSIDELQSSNKYYRELRPKDFTKGDLIIGEFYGDSDLLLLRCDPESKDYGAVLIALPFDNRSDWYCSVNFENFITDYVNYEGDKFWEIQTKK